jgi:hypothetical protein
MKGKSMKRRGALLKKKQAKKIEQSGTREFQEAAEREGQRRLPLMQPYGSKT